MITRLTVSRVSNRTIWAHPFRWQSFIKMVGAAGISLLLCGLGGCRQSPRQPVTVTIIDPEWSQPDVSPEAKQESQQFTRETGIRVEHPPIPETSLSQLELSRKLLREGGPTPDVFAIDVIWPGMLGDYLIDLKPYFAAELSSLDPELVASYTVNGKVVAIPYHAHIGVLAYRTDLLRQYGYRRPPKTWDELEEMGTRIQAGERAKGKKDFWGYVWQGAPGEGLTCNALEWQVSEGGGRIIEKDKTVSVNNPDVIRAWQRAKRWVGWISPPSVVAFRETDSMNLWKSGRAAFWRTWQWDYRLTHWHEPAMGDRTGYTSVPSGKRGRAGALGGTGLAISRSSDHPQEAIALVRFLIGRELQSKKDSAGAKPPQQPELYDLPQALNPYTHSATTNQQSSGVVVRPSIVVGDAYEDVTRAYFQSVHSVLTGERSAPEAAAALEKQLTQITGFIAGPPKPE
jgi:trehalose/maltose transport system substrate-binding protein